jgi:LmbE family N-acetylglucosaminyl deacetylase
MRLSRPGADVYIPSGEAPEGALARATLLGVAAHADDLECMAYAAILSGYRDPGEAFCGVVLSDGAGGPRQGAMAGVGDTELVRLRREEQRNAARIGRYAAQIQLDHPSAAVKDAGFLDTVDDLEAVLGAVRPREVYTHNPADKHDTHVATFLRLLAALRRLAPGARPSRLIGCEVWRDLDWLPDRDKVLMPVDGEEGLARALLEAFPSQNSAGKRFDLATLGRRRAHAVFLERRAADGAGQLTLGMDLTPLLLDAALSPSALVARHLDSFRTDVLERLRLLGGA